MMCLSTYAGESLKQIMFRCRCRLINHDDVGARDSLGFEKPVTIDIPNITSKFGDRRGRL